MRKVLNTGRGCPIVQIYLEVGQWPSRFELQKMRCLFLKLILKQDEQSMVYKFFHLQLNQPVKGDWVSTCLGDLKKLKIFETLEEIKIMSEHKFSQLLKRRIKENALEYLQLRRGSKGQGIKYSRLEMSEYLLPHITELNIEEKRKLFEMKNRMTNIPNNFGIKNVKCLCGADEIMSHIYECEKLNERKEIISYEELENGKMKDQIEILKRFECSMEKRTKLKEIEIQEETKPPCDFSNPLNCKKCRNG